MVAIQLAVTNEVNGMLYIHKIITTSINILFSLLNILDKLTIIKINSKLVTIAKYVR